MTKNIDQTFMEAYQDLVDAANNITPRRITTYRVRTDTANDEYRQMGDVLGTPVIDESMKLFDQGMKDAELCNKMLDEAEQKIEVFNSDEE